MHLDDKVLFIHNPRTSGTAIRKALLFGDNPNEQPQWPEHLGKHAFPDQLRYHISEDVWDSRIKFSVVRNPWERLVSLYGMFRRPTEPEHLSKSRYNAVKINKLVKAVCHPSICLSSPREQRKKFNSAAFKLPFVDWLKWCEKYQWQGCPYLGLRPMTAIPQSNWFKDLDRVLRFEDRKELNDFLNDLGYPELTIENTTRHDPWQKYYDAESYEYVARIFADDIKRFGY